MRVFWWVDDCSHVLMCVGWLSLDPSMGTLNTASEVEKYLVIFWGNSIPIGHECLLPTVLEPAGRGQTTSVYADPCSLAPAVKLTCGFQ